MSTRLKFKREKPSSRSFKRKSGAMFKLWNWSMYTYVLEGGCPTHAPKIPCHSDSYVSFPITFSGIFHWAGVYQWFPGNPSMKHALQENRKNKKYEGKKKNIGLSEMHNIFVAADEEKRKTFMKKQIK